MTFRGNKIPVEDDLPLEEPMSHDHGAEVLGDNLDKEVEDQRLRPLGPLAPIGPGIPILSLEVDMYEDFARVEMGETRMITGPKLQDEAMFKRCKNTKNQMLINWIRKPDVAEYPLGFVSDRPHPLRDVFHVEPRDPLHVARAQVIQVER